MQRAHRRNQADREPRRSAPRARRRAARPRSAAPSARAQSHVRRGGRAFGSGSSSSRGYRSLHEKPLQVHPGHAGDGPRKGYHHRAMPETAPAPAPVGSRSAARRSRRCMRRRRAARAARSSLAARTHGRLRRGQRRRRPDVRRRGPGRQRGRAGAARSWASAGKLLETLLAEIGMARADVFIANV